MTGRWGVGTGGTGTPSRQLIRRRIRSHVSIYPRLTSLISMTDGQYMDKRSPSSHWLLLSHFNVRDIFCHFFVTRECIELFTKQRVLSNCLVFLFNTLFLSVSFHNFSGRFSLTVQNEDILIKTRHFPCKSSTWDLLWKLFWKQKWWRYCREMYPCTLTHIGTCGDFSHKTRQNIWRSLIFS